MAPTLSVCALLLAPLTLCTSLRVQADWEPNGNLSWKANLHSESAVLQKQCPEARSSFHNLCIDGRIAPEFMLLGAQKAATTSFAVMMNCPEMVWAETFPDEKGFFKKELHFFDDDERFHRGKHFWLSHYPKCDQSERLIAVDDTPNYMFTDSAPVAAQRIHEFYGEQRGLIKFVVILREPMTRIHSAFHFYVDMGWNSRWTGAGFKNYATAFTANLTDDPCDFVKDSNYTAQLSAYFKYFSRAQFTIIPFLDVVAPLEGKASGDSVLFTWDNLGFNTTGLKPPNMVQVNDIPHAKLLDELSTAELAAARKALGKSIRVDAIASLLTSGKSDPKLPGYTGGMSDKAHIARWIESRW